MQGTIEQLSARNSELMAEKALGNWAPKDGSPDATDCSLTALVQVDLILLIFLLRYILKI